MKLFVGCYTKKISEEIIGKGKGIYCFDFDSTTGQLEIIEVIPALNPSYITVSKDKNYLYAVEEIDISESPKIKSFKINSHGNYASLTLLNEQKLPGSYACHLNSTNSQSHLIVGCYMSGNILIYPLNGNGEILPLYQSIQHIGKGPNIERQEMAHVHMIYTYDSSSFIAVDLGLDVAKTYNFDNSSKQFVEASELEISIIKGAGARHMASHPSKEYVFILSELSAELHSFKRVNTEFISLEVIPTLTPEFKNTPSGAAIRIHPNGKYLYVSNRGINTISIFKFDTESEKLLLLKSEPSGGKTPRDINIDPTGNWLLVANQDSDNIVVFKINQETGLLKKHAVNNQLKSASCILFV